MCVSQQSLEIPLKSSGHHIYTWKKHAVCLKHLPCFLYYYFLNSFRMSLRIQITCSDSWHCFCNRWWKLREWSNTVTAKPYLLQKPKDQKDALVFSSVKGKQRFGFFFSSAYMCTCWVMFDSLWPCGQSSGSSVHWIFQARILEWVAISFSKGSSQPRDRTRVSCVGRWILYHCAILLLSDFTLWSMPWACASYITWCTIFHGFFTTWSCVSGR